jgi:L-threonylcarbamoyladenylate synthase
MKSPLLTAEIDQVVAVLRRGGVAAIPTDTLYALAADATAPAAVARVFAIKGRGASQALPLFVDGIAMADTIALLTDAARVLAGRFWPGALTLVVRKRDEFESAALAGGDTVALRAPAHPIALAILRDLGRPITGTSANRSGGADPATAVDVRRQLGREIGYILDSGPCPVGLPSTIVDCAGAELRVLRPGAVSEQSIREALAP